MSEVDGQPEQLFSDNYYSDSKSPNDQQPLSQKDLFEDDAKEERIGEMNKRSKYKMQSVPSVAVPEKIVICIDTSQDTALGYTSFDSNKNTEAPTIMKEALRVFLINKLAIAKDTTFALVSFQSGNVQVISHFTSNIKQLVQLMSEMDYGTNEEGMADNDITSLFSEVFNRIELPETQSKNIPPEFVVRVIFIYNNSRSVPRLNVEHESYEKFLNSPYCIFDIVYLHEGQSDFNSVLKIHEEFSKIISPHSYLLECSRNVTQVFNSFAKLLAHPYQRVGLQG